MLRPRSLPRADRTDLPLAAALLVQAVVVLALPRVLTVDGPAHLAGGWALWNLREAFVGGIYTVDPSPVPNVLVTVLLAPLVGLLGPDTGEKLLVLGCLTLLPLAVRWALRGLDPRAGWAAVLAVPFASGYLFLYGFYNFVLGLGLALAAVALALHRRHGWTTRSALGLTGLLLLTWAAHLLPALLASVVLALLALSRTVVTRGVRVHLLPVVLAGVPVAGLTLAFLLSPAAERGAPQDSEDDQRLRGLLTLRDPLVAYSPWEQVPAALLALLLAGLAVRALRAAPGPARADRTVLWAATGLAVLAHQVSPARYGQEYGLLDDRLSLFPPLLLLLAAAGPPPGPRARRAVVAAALACAAALGLLRLPTELRYQRQVAELVSVAGLVPAGSTLVAVRLWRDPPEGGRLRNPYRDALRHEASRVAVLAGAVDAGHYEAALPYFPVRFREGSSPRDAVDPTGRGLGRVPPALDLSGAPVDVVLVVGRDRARPSALERGAPLLAVLEQEYVRVAVSSPTALVEVWRRR